MCFVQQSVRSPWFLLKLCWCPSGVFSASSFVSAQPWPLPLTVPASDAAPSSSVFCFSQLCLEPHQVGLLACPAPACSLSFTTPACPSSAPLVRCSLPSCRFSSPGRFGFVGCVCMHAPFAPHRCLPWSALPVPRALLGPCPLGRVGCAVEVCFLHAVHAPFCPSPLPPLNQSPQSCRSFGPRLVP